MSNIIQELFDFISAAERSRNYPSKVASNHRSPLRLIEPELTEEEKNSLEILQNNLDKIFQTVYDKNKSRMSASSIAVYNRRVRSLIDDYEKYGTDPGKMASWNRQLITRKHSKVKQEIAPAVSITGQTENINQQLPEMTVMNRHQFSFGAFISTPSSLTKKQYEEIDSYVKYLKTTVIDQESQGTDINDKDKG